MRGNFRCTRQAQALGRLRDHERQRSSPSRLGQRELAAGAYASSPCPRGQQTRGKQTTDTLKTGGQRQIGTENRNNELTTKTRRPTDNILP